MSIYIKSMETSKWKKQDVGWLMGEKKIGNQSYSLSTLSWRGRKTGKIGIHLTENGSNQRHVIFDGR